MKNKVMTYERPRRFEKYELSFHPYEIATALFSFGDVLEIVGKEDSERKSIDERRGLILVDTIGHVEDSGKSMKAFLQKIIAEGWGSKENAATEMWNLGLMLRGMWQTQEGVLIPLGVVDKKEYSSDRLDLIDEWYYHAASQFVQFYGETIDIVNADMPFPYILRESGELERLSFTWRRIDEPVSDINPALIVIVDEQIIKLKRPDESYPITLEPEEVLFLRSDGVDDGILHRSPRYHGKHSHLDDVYMDDLFNFFKRNKHKSSVEIRDSFISEFGEYFIPKDPRHDDATFAIIKRSD